MNQLENYTVDVMRLYNERSEKLHPISVAVIVNSYMKFHTNAINLVPEISQRIIENGWAELSDTDKLKINESGKKYLDQISTDEYIVDRCFELLKEEESPTYIDTLLNKQFIKSIIHKRIPVLEAMIVNSGLVHAPKTGRYHELKLNTKGIMVLDKYDRYSDYEKAMIEEAQKQKQPAPSVAFIKDACFRFEIGFDDVLQFVKETAQEEEEDISTGLVITDLESGVYLRCTIPHLNSIFAQLCKVEPDVIAPFPLPAFESLTQYVKEPENVFGDKRLVRFKVGFK